MQVRGGQLWGTDVYTVDSDLVAGMLSDIFCSFLSLLFFLGYNFLMLHNPKLLDATLTDIKHSCLVLMHTGYCRPTASPPPSATQELRANIRVLPPQDCMFNIYPVINSLCSLNRCFHKS